MKNPMDMTSNDIICIGQFDADELTYIEETPKVKAMVEQGRIGLNFIEYDCGSVWVKLGDKKAFKLASQIVM